jgi:hypothetical protein
MGARVVVFDLIAEAWLLVAALTFVVVLGATLRADESDSAARSVSRRALDECVVRLYREQDVGRDVGRPPAPWRRDAAYA